jgi:tetratricopeptide (TPR) repeat protein
MDFRDILIISRGTKVILAITFSVSLAAVIFAFFYYSTINRSEDPRIAKAREFMQKYERAPAHASEIYLFELLDSALAVFRSLPEYERSFETGVIYNNKCSTLLLSALYDSTSSLNTRKSLLSVSMKYCDSSIIIYNEWINSWGALNTEEIALRVKKYMKEDDPAFSGYNYKRLLVKRISNIITAQIETPRRLSVSYTNKGAIYRHMTMPDSSAACYSKALSLWKDNRVAKSNLSVLMGGSPVKASVIESLFPPDRNKK